MVEDKHDNNNPPTRAEFEDWTIRQRHDFIKKDAGPRFKLTYPGVWGYLFYPKSDMCIRSKVDRKRNIVAVEVYSIDEGNRLTRPATEVNGGPAPQ